MGMTVGSQAAAARNPFLEGNFAPVRDELDFEHLDVLGAIPEDLEGSFLRVGPNPQFVADVEKYHWFDGDGMIHRVHFAGGRAAYRNRFVRTRGFELESERGGWIWRGLNSPPDFENPHGVFKNVANTAFAHHAGRLLVLWEGGEPHRFSVPDLATLGAESFGGSLEHPFTAHPKIDPETGEMMTFGYSVASPPYCTYSVMDARGKIVHTTPIELSRPVMMHDFAITERHSLFIDMPVTFSLERALNGGAAFGWEPDHGMRLGVLPRFADGAQIRWYEVETGAIIHTGNAFEEGDEIVLEGPRFDKQSVLGETDGVAPSESEEFARLHQWRLDLKTGRARERRLDAIHLEFPRINDARCGREHRFLYASRQCAAGSEVLFDALIKYDRATGTTQRHELGADRFCGEGVFAPRRGAVAEDDGWVITFVHDEGTHQSECLVLDARDYAADPVARIRIPVRVPYGFHAGWVAAE
jgi:carotenoid cleavage dioxygenase